MKVIYLLFMALLAIFGWNQHNETESFSSNTSDSAITDSSSSEEQENKYKTQFEVGKELFSVKIPHFNILSEADISDQNGNTWIVMQSEIYDNLLIQISVHNKASEKIPEDYSPEELGLKIETSIPVNYHYFKSESLATAENSKGQIYKFETDTIEGQLLLVADDKLVNDDIVLFEKVINSIMIE